MDDNILDQLSRTDAYHYRMKARAVALLRQDLEYYNALVSRDALPSFLPRIFCSGDLKRQWVNQRNELNALEHRHGAPLMPDVTEFTTILFDDDNSLFNDFIIVDESDEDGYSVTEEDDGEPYEYYK